MHVEVTFKSSFAWTWIDAKIFFTGIIIIDENKYKINLFQTAQMLHGGNFCTYSRRVT